MTTLNFDQNRMTGVLFVVIADAVPADIITAPIQIKAAATRFSRRCDFLCRCFIDPCVRARPTELVILR